MQETNENVNSGPAVSSARLNVYAKSGNLVSTIPLEDGSYVIGRSEECNIQCEGASNISRRHAELVIAHGTAHIRDLNSTVGMMVNNTIRSESDLNDGDIIQLGMMKFQLLLPKIVPAPGDNAARPKLIRAVDETKVANFDRELTELAEQCAKVRSEIGKVVVGQKDIVEGILSALLCAGHCLLVGVPGLAKTVMVCTFADVLGLKTHRIQFTPDLMPSDIIGSEMLKKNSSGVPELQFVQGPVFTQLLLADEINRTPPKTQAALLEAMQERQVTVSMRSYQLPLPFCVIATQNPVEQEGTYPLPEAQQDRFMYCLNLDYPTAEEELEIIRRTTAKDFASADCVFSDANEIIRFQQAVQCIGVPEEQMALAVRIIRSTRPNSPEAKKFEVSQYIDWGAGPRAGQAVIRGAKASAAMDGRPAITSDDIRKQLLPVLRHRIVCNYRAKAEGMTEDAVIRRIMERAGL